MKANAIMKVFVFMAYISKRESEEQRAKSKYTAALSP